MNVGGGASMTSSLQKACISDGRNGENNNIIDKLQDTKEFNKKFAKSSSTGTNSIIMYRWKVNSSQFFEYFSL